MLKYGPTDRTKLILLAVTAWGSDYPHSYLKKLSRAGNL